MGEFARVATTKYLVGKKHKRRVGGERIIAQLKDTWLGLVEGATNNVQ